MNARPDRKPQAAPSPERKPLADAQIRALRAIQGRRVELFDGDISYPGLSIRANANGTKTWSLLYRESRGNAQRRLKLGQYPAVGLADARELAAEKLRLIAFGQDPSADRADDREAMLFGTMADEFLDHKLQQRPDPKRQRTVAEYRRILTNVADGHGWKRRAVVDIDVASVRAVVKEIAKSAPVAANRVLAVLSSAFSFAMKDLQLRTDNPCRAISKPTREKRRERVLDDAEIQQLWAACEAVKTFKPTKKRPRPPITGPVARFLQMLLVTGQRSGETARMRWDDIELPDDWIDNRQLAGAWWQIPGSETKNGRTHRVWLTATALDLLREARSATPKSSWVFAATVRTNTNISDRSKRAMPDLKRTKAIMFHATRHDLRRTAFDGMRRAGVTRADAAIVVNHAPVGGGGATSHYDVYEDEVAKREALTKWSRALDRILTPGSNVVAFNA